MIAATGGFHVPAHGSVTGQLEQMMIFTARARWGRERATLQAPPSGGPGRHRAMLDGRAVSMRPRARFAAPIRDLHREVAAAISIGVPVDRFDAVILRKHATALVEAGEAVSRRLGWNPRARTRDT